MVLAQLSEGAWEPPLWLEQLSERALLEPPLGQLSKLSTILRTEPP
jgi:hypothetical protein